MNPNAVARTRALDAASDIVVNDGMASVTMRTVAHRASLGEAELEALFPSIDGLLVELLDREFSGLRRTVADSVERDPAGGLLSRIYGYSLSAAHERPLARSLYLQDPESLTRLVRIAGHGSFRGLAADRTFIVAMQRGGMLQPDVDVDELTAFLSAYMVGSAMTAQAVDIDASVPAVVRMLERAVDADVDDTEPGKRAFFDLIDRAQ